MAVEITIELTNNGVTISVGGPDTAAAGNLGQVVGSASLAPAAKPADPKPGGDGGIGIDPGPGGGGRGTCAAMVIGPIVVDCSASSVPSIASTPSGKPQTPVGPKPGGDGGIGVDPGPGGGGPGCGVVVIGPIVIGGGGRVNSPSVAKQEPPAAAPAPTS